MPLRRVQWLVVKGIFMMRLAAPGDEHPTTARRIGRTQGFAPTVGIDFHDKDHNHIPFECGLLQFSTEPIAKPAYFAGMAQKGFCNWLNNKGFFP